MALAVPSSMASGVQSGASEIAHPGRPSDLVVQSTRSFLWQNGPFRDLPSGKRLHSYGKSLLFIDKSAINGHFQ